MELTKIKNENIIFATSIEKSDDRIFEFCKKNSYPCYRGSKNNVALRMLNCSKHFQFSTFIRICGDNVFTDKNLINDMIDIYEDNDYDIVTNTPGRTFPYGISVEIIKTNFFEDIYSLIKSSSDKEHVTKFIYDHSNDYDIYQYKSNEKKYRGVKLALDTQKDFDVISQVIKKFKKDHRTYSIDDIVDLYYSVTKDE